MVLRNSSYSQNSDPDTAISEWFAANISMLPGQCSKVIKALVENVSESW